MLEKGFLGPIGDDLPSLIPLLFALLVFFSTFSFSFGVFNQENTAFEGDLAVLNISRILKGTNYITGIEDFLKKCDNINISNIKYRAGITNYFTAWENYEESGYVVDPPPRSYLIGFFKNKADKFFRCTNAVEPDFSDESETEKFFMGRTILVKLYPLVVEDERVVKPMHLVVVAWKG